MVVVTVLSEDKGTEKVEHQIALTVQQWYYNNVIHLYVQQNDRHGAVIELQNYKADDPLAVSANRNTLAAVARPHKVQDNCLVQTYHYMEGLREWDLSTQNLIIPIQTEVVEMMLSAGGTVLAISVVDRPDDCLTTTGLNLNTISVKILVDTLDEPTASWQPMRAPIVNVNQAFLVSSNGTILVTTTTTTNDAVTDKP